jgi:hypothetical protein
MGREVCRMLTCSDMLWPAPTCLAVCQQSKKTKKKEVRHIELNALVNQIGNDEESLLRYVVNLATLTTS